MRTLLIRWLVLAVAIAIAAALINQVDISGGVLGLLGVAALFGLVNALIGPILRLLAIPLRIVTLGLISFVINAGLVLITAWISDVLDVGGFFPALGAAVIISIVSVVLNRLVVDRRRPAHRH
jgi:putative membrane protein